MSAHVKNNRTRIPRTIRALAVPIILVWVAVTAAVNLLVPQVEKVGMANAVSMSPQDAPAVIAAKRMGQKFQESSSDSIAMVVLVGDQPLGDAARRYYETLVEKFKADSKHVEHVQDFWGDMITAAGVQSSDGKAAYVQLNLAGDQGSTEGNHSVDAVRTIIDQTPPPAGLHAYVTGPAPLTTDSLEASDRGMIKMTVVTMIVITIMLALVYRSVSTVLLILAIVGIEMGAARGAVAVIGHLGIMDFSTFSVPLMTALSIAAGTDYAIFLIGRYHEARQNGEDPESAYYSAFHGVGHVILGSGLTIAGAMLTLRLTRLSYFNSLAYPSAMALIIVVAAALTVAPAILVVASRFGLLDPKRMMKTRGWRKVGTATVRWPKPILAAATSVVLLGLLAMIGYKTSYDDRRYIPSDVPANVGYAAAEKHFSTARLNPDIMTIESDHDMRNPTDMIVLDRIAKALFRIKGIAMVQSITRPLGSPIAHSSIPYQISMSSVPITQNLQFLKQRVGDISKMSDDMGAMIGSMTQLQALMVKFSDAMHTTVGSGNGMVESAHRSIADMDTMKATLDQMRDNIANFDDEVRPFRNYFYWEPNCFNIPACFAVRSAFDAMDGVNTFSDNMASLQTDMTAMVDGMDKMVNGMDSIDALVPQMVAQFGPIIATATTMQHTLQTIHSSFDGLIQQMQQMTDTATAMGEAFDASKSDDYFYLPPEVFANPDFQKGLKLFLSPDGKAARLIVTHDVNPASEAGISVVDDQLTAAHEAIKGTALANADVYLTGTAATYRDVQAGAKYDTMIAAFAALTLIFIVMLIITRALVASMVIVGTVVISLGAAFGLSVFIFERIVGIELNWIVLAFAVIILMAVGSDYNLLLVSRFKEEIGAGINTGIIRSMGSTGTVVTAAGLVFAFTMGSMISGDLLNVGQGGMTIGIGLLLDTLIVRSLMTPSIAAILGPWFWWPLRVRQRPAYSERMRAVPAERAVTSGTGDDTEVLAPA
ncbi:RND family transporter [Mycolicibacterium aichiense]|uniref:Membrane protein, MmpL n=1 Tax=Mycolicibacterium aichiense TaxID=1799 RepID=A0AAD1MB21_9MYCO|nr:MMPL family transporter [Mycolicibacterium aichiense]MCV7018116.1 MMPL family transporter [Mycolicibacterium aichiense]BBX07068.1 putative membrane protein, MmpL [Mycolicibacterium aichiense]STZ80883.1 transmembrane transport protein MmpL [Mycolicibacterium aichiense]